MQNLHSSSTARLQVGVESSSSPRFALCFSFTAVSATRHTSRKADCSQNLDQLISLLRRFGPCAVDCVLSAGIMLIQRDSPLHILLKLKSSTV